MADDFQIQRFRPFVVEDAPLLGTWLAAVGLGVPAGVPSRTWADRLIRDPNISCWVAEHDDRAVGFFRLDTGPDRQAEVTLIVAPWLRRQGVGQVLFAEVLNQARARGIRRILAVVAEHNTAALRFFQATGFSKNGSKTPGNMHLQRLVHGSTRQPPLEIQP